MGRQQSQSDPDPASREIAKQTDLALFSGLPSVQAARKDKSCLNIAYDCEYQSVGKDWRIILSYQFAVYLTEVAILEIVFLSKRMEEVNKLILLHGGYLIIRMMLSGQSQE